MSFVLPDSPSARAEDLLRRVMGHHRYQTFVQQGYLDTPSRLRRGRVYRLDTSGNLSYRDPGQGSFVTTLCIQPAEPLPRGDLIAARYLMVTTDEPALLATANPIRFSLWSIATALFRDARERQGVVVAYLYTIATLALFLGALLLEAASAAGLLAAWPVVGLILCVVAAPAAALGFVLLIAGLADVWWWVTGALGLLLGRGMPVPEAPDGERRNPGSRPPPDLPSVAPL